MVRKREDVLRSITALLSEVNSVALAIGRITPKPVTTFAEISPANHTQDGLISRHHSDAITEALLRIQSATAANSNTKIINALVSQTLNSAVEAWLNENLADLVEEVVDEQLNKYQNKKWGG
jgi:cell pole-organizing protein PopZ